MNQTMSLRAAIPGHVICSDTVRDALIAKAAFTVAVQRAKKIKSGLGTEPTFAFYGVVLTEQRHGVSFPISGPVAIDYSGKTVGVQDLTCDPLVPNEVLQGPEHWRCVTV